MSKMQFPILAVLLVLTACAGVSQSPPRLEDNLGEVREVARITDGDTLKLVSGDRIRSACIDAPESDQPFGDEATARLQQLVEANGGTVRLVVSDVDRYGRQIAGVWVGEQSAQEVLVGEGLAYVYERYISNCPLDADRLRVAQRSAQQAEVGVWSAPTSIPPWEWRRRSESISIVSSS